jgi:predicted SprT family Zn-dependent metalloprotease
LLFFFEHFNKKHLKETCYHEVAHVVAGVAAKHGPAWKRVMNDFGYPNAEACTDLNEKPNTIVKQQPIKPNTIVKQPKPIKPKVTNFTSTYIC